jgi:hypothetical protein
MQNDTYVTSMQTKVMHQAFLLARRDYELNNPKCDLQIDEQLRIPDEQKLFMMVKEQAQRPGRKAIAGITRSNFARLSATAAKGSDLRGIASASFTDELKSINPNFITVCDSWEKQLEASVKYMRQTACVDSNTLGARPT